MVSGKSIAAVALVVCAVAVGSIIYSSIDTDVAYPGSNVIDDKIVYPRSMSVESLHDFRVVVSYPSNKIYEGTEFKVEVCNADTEKVVEGANVSFILPGISLTIPKEGSVYFSAPWISKQSAPHIRMTYIEFSNDTNASFPLVVKKEGYNTYTTAIVVHLTKNK